MADVKAKNDRQNEKDLNLRKLQSAKVVLDLMCVCVCVWGGGGGGGLFKGSQ